MELWIRSQDKERLMKATDIRIYYVKEENIWVIEDCDDLGYYQTKERALEVLDEIESLIVGNTKFLITGEQVYTGIKSKDLQSVLYEMPKE